MAFIERDRKIAAHPKSLRVSFISTYLAPSAIQGVGVFTPVRLPKGTIIWEYNPSIDHKLTPAELEQLPEPFRSRIHELAFLNREGIYMLCGGNAKFMNHSEIPNCDELLGEKAIEFVMRHENRNCTDSAPHITVTNRDIGAHEELTCDYLAFDMELYMISGPLYK